MRRRKPIRPHRPHHPNHPVLELIRNRVAIKSQPGERSDGAQLALVIEGGGMRGVVSSGMAAALEQFGCVDAVDAVYGVSAGAVIGAYFIAGQTNYGTSTFYDTLTDDRFFSWRRFVRRGSDPAMRLRYLIDDVMKHQRPLEYDQFFQSPIPLHVFAASVRSGEFLDLPRAQTVDELDAQLEAACCVPLIAGGPIPIGDDLFYDGGVIRSFPHHQAIADGATHILVLRSRPHGVAGRKLLPTDKAILQRHFTKQAYHPELYTRYLQSETLSQEDIDWYYEQSHQPTDGPHILAVAAAPHSAVISNFEQNRQRLVEGAQSGMQAVYSMFGTAAGPVEMLVPAQAGRPISMPLPINLDS